MLIKTIEELKGYIGTLHQGTSVKTVLPFVEQAELKYILPFIGMEQLAALTGAYDAGTFTPEESALHKYLGRSIAYYAVLEALPFLTATIGDGGVMEPSYEGVASARQWVYHNLLETSATNADVFLDMGLQYMDTHIDKFSVFAESEAYRNSKSLFINTAADLSRYLNLQGSRRAFLALAPFQLRAEEIYIAPVLGDEMYQELKDALLQPSQITPEQAKTINLIKPALAQLTLFEAIPEVAYTFTGGGIKILNVHDGIRQRLSAGRDEKNDLRVIANSRANIYLEAVKRHLDTLMVPEVNPNDERQAVQPIDNTYSTSFWV